MARYAGVKSNFVSVSKDHKGKSVNHACACVNVNNESILVDPAYRQYDIRHKKIKIKADDEVLRMFHDWRVN